MAGLIVMVKEMNLKWKDLKGFDQGHIHYPGFLEAVQKYEKTRAAQKHRTGITLGALRNLQPEHARWGQQDAVEMLHALIGLVDARTYPHLFGSISIDRRFTRLEEKDQSTTDKSRLEGFI